MSEASDRALDTGESDALPIPAHLPSRKRQVVQGLITLAVLVVVFGFVLPKLADYRAVLDHISSIDVMEWVVLIALAGAVLIAYVVVLMSAMRTLHFKEAYVAQTTAQAVNNSLPAGGAIALPLQYAMYMSWGFTPEAITAMLISVGIWDQFARFGLPILALGIGAISEDTAWWMWAIALAGVILIGAALLLLWAVFRNEALARRIGSWLERWTNKALALIHRPPANVEHSVMQFRANAIDVVQRRWKWLTLTTFINHTAQAALFVASLRAIGVGEDAVPTVWVVAAFALGRLLTMIPVSPGGLGLVDLGWIGLLTAGWNTAVGPVDPDLLTAGTLLFRALTYLPPILLGLISWIIYRLEKGWRRQWQVVRRGEWDRVAR